ncbi:uncharacterized protein [Osmerus mordax]|uniref:uncharacterized protein n=1 Tax=Osmerus mordax TaxID=8014 RepID=UPI00350F9721
MACKGYNKPRKPNSPYFVEEFLETNTHPEDQRVYVMYHGTTKNDAEKIKLNGFERSDGQGRTLGAGVYVSRDTQKDMQYPPGVSKNKKRVLELKVNVGRVLVIDKPDHPMMKTWQDSYDSAWLKAGVLHPGSSEEGCIHDPIRIKVVSVKKQLCAQLTEGVKPVEHQAYVMYHGTTAQIGQAIWASGFQPSSDGMLGRGVYVTRDIRKAIKYPDDDKIPDSNRVVLKVKVDVGKVKVINRQGHDMQKTWHRYGFDTAWLPPNAPNVGMVRSGQEENCVYDPNRIKRVAILKVPILKKWNPSLK